MKDSTKEKFLIVLEDHKKILFKISSAYCKNAADREDLIQEMILQLWRAFPKYDAQYKLSTWIYRIALNVSISFYRKENKRKKITITGTDNLVNIEMEATATDPKIALLYQFIGQLKELDRALMILYLDEKKHEEIAAVLGISTSNVGTKITRIKQQLKRFFNQLNHES